MNCSNCGGTVVSAGKDAYRFYWRCVDCGQEFSTPIPG
ncbi:hypothetical protein LCGC14_1550200 [marine sediment metagenome]|uniref:Uncharacterized protein n=1 Tax=marine sediment metagenome TaxID=412755 RepID=A0A0F9LRB4_9ZZZZ